MDLKKLLADVLDVAEKAAPLVGLAEEVEAGKALVHSIEKLVGGVKTEVGPKAQEQLQDRVEALVARANRLADDLDG